jgi:hypothetical protein
LKLITTITLGILVLLSIFVAGCYEEPLEGTTAAGETSEADLVASIDDVETLLTLNQRWVEGLSVSDLDLEDVEEVFWNVFSKLPEAVTVYPSENYYYFILYVDGRQIWGNIRLAAGRRERGVLSFAYFEYRESPFVREPRLRKSKFFTEADGLTIEELDPFKFKVGYNGRDVTFNLHKIPQDPPKLFDLAPDEIFVMRTFDESGYQFFLLFNAKDDYLFWVLNEEAELPDRLEVLQPDLLAGRRSGFAFYVDSAHQDRKVLAAIRGANATVNNYYDGPFDQLADNYVEETNVSEYLVRAVPSLDGRIDKYGYYLDRETSSRVAVSPYFVYFSDRELLNFMAGVRAADDPYRAISDGARLRFGGSSATPTPSNPNSFPTPYPTPFQTPSPVPSGLATPVN